MRKIILIFALMIFSSIFMIGCDEEVDSNTNSSNISFNIFTIQKDGSFSWKECQERELDDKVIMIESKYCGHCQKTLPVFKGVAQEKEVVPLILDIAEEEDREKMESFGLNVKYTPTFIFGCDYITGAKSQEEYEKMFNNFKALQEGLG